jgi:hypothetical protein
MKTIKQLKDYLRKDLKKYKIYFKEFQAQNPVFEKKAWGKTLFLSSIVRENKKFFNRFIDYIDNKQYYLVNEQGDIARVNEKNLPLMAQKFKFNKKTELYSTKEINTVYGKLTIIPNGLDINKEYKLTIQVNCEVRFSEVFVPKKFTQTLKIAPYKLQSIHNQKFFVLDYYGLIDPEEPDEDQIYGDNDVRNMEFTILSAKTKQVMKLDNMVLRESNPTHLTQLYNDIIPISEGNCIQKHLGNIYSKFSKKEIKTLNTTEDLLNYSKRHDIKMIAYDIKGKVISSNYPAKPNTCRKALIYIAYNNHIYPLKNHLLNKINHTVKLSPVYVADVNMLKLFLKLYHEHGPPRDLKMNGENIISFVYDDKIYHCNDDYEKCKHILSKFGLEDKMTIYTKIKNIGEIIEQLYIKSNIKSFMPGSDRYNKGAYNYHNEESVPLEEDVITIDKVKCYSSCLASLENLIWCDQKMNEFKKLPFGDRYLDKKDGVNIIPHYLYIVEPELSTILIPHKNIYTGETVKYAIEKGLNIKILEEQETQITENYYKQMIIDCYNKLDNEDFKEMINPLIGRFESSQVIKYGLKYDMVGNDDTTDCMEGFKIKLAYGVNVIMKETKTFNLYNKKPIAIQVKDKSRIVLYEMMEKLNLCQEDIIQIKTDSITFYNKPELKKNNNYKNYIKNDLDGWKIEKYTPINPRKFSNINPNMTFELISDDNENMLCNCMAGSGKTYEIINKILKPNENEDLKEFELQDKKIHYETPEGDCECGLERKNICYCSNPKIIKYFDNNYCNNCDKWCCRCENPKKFTQKIKVIEEEKNTRIRNKETTLVVTPSHATLKEYRKIGTDCDVIQKVEYFNTIPKQDMIIVDEVGMVDAKGWNWMYKMKLLDKKIYAYGDQNQLLPVKYDKTFFTENWINYFFKNHKIMDTNFRNHFTKEYYYSLINSKDKKFLINEIKKYNCKKFEDADVIITYRNKTRVKYNEKMCEKLGINNKTDKGAKIICKTNKFKARGVCNGFDFEVVEFNKHTDKCVLWDGIDLYEFTEEQINKNFDYGYARTLYSIQGESKKSFYFAPEDLKYQHWITARFTYTLISRLKTK